MEENQQLFQPLIYPPSATITTTTPRGHRDIKADESILNIFFRLVLVTFIVIVAIWANHEASKGFAITIVNEAGADTFLAKRFSLFYLSNDEATRIVIKASKIVENFLYPNYMYNKKKVNRVTLKLADRSLSDGVVVEFGKEDEFVLHLSPSIMEDQNFKHTMLLEVKKGVARIWLWDGQGNAPHNLINGIVEFIASSFSASNAESSPVKAKPLASTTAYWKHDDTRVVAEFLNYCERSRPGFIRRLNQEMKDGWHERKLDIALGMPVQNLCTTYNSSKHNFSSTLNY